MSGAADRTGRPSTFVGDRPAAVVATLGALLLVASCSIPTVTSDTGSGARKLLLERSEQGPVTAVVIGNPFGMDQGRLDSLVTQAMGDGVTGVSADFTTDPSRAVAVEPRLVVLLNPAGDPSGSAACRSPSLVRTLPGGEDLRVFAAFCDGADPLGSAAAQGTVSGPTDRRFQRLLWRTAAALFPDDYEDTYGFGLLPNSFDFGFGSSEPPLGDDPLAPPEDFDPLAPQPPE